jgi:hypothetical protein
MTHVPVARPDALNCHPFSLSSSHSLDLPYQNTSYSKCTCTCACARVFFVVQMFLQNEYRLCIVWNQGSADNSCNLTENTKLQIVIMPITRVKTGRNRLLQISSRPSISKHSITLLRQCRRWVLANTARRQTSQHQSVTRQHSS